MNIKAKGKRRKLKTGFKVGLCVALVFAAFLIAKANEPKIVGYTYDSGDTVWEMASRCCPEGMDMQSVAREIERLNGIENSTVYEGVSYKVPVYGTKAEYLNLKTVERFEVTEKGLSLYTFDGNEYVIKG